jgi:hypothetical protein
MLPDPRLWATTWAWVIGVLALLGKEPRRNVCCWLWWWDGPLARDAIRQGAVGGPSGELREKRPPKYLCEKGGRRVADLSNLVSIVAFDLPVSGEALQAKHLLGGQWPAVPVEWSGGGPRVCWQCPSWLLLCELKKEGPVSCSVSE